MTASQENIWTPLKLLDWTTTKFADAGFDCARLDAQVLLAEALACDRVSLYTQFDKPLGKPELDRFRSFVRRRLNNEPVAYIIGKKEFWSRTFAVSPAVLIPRPDTEVLIEVCQEILPKQKDITIVDVGTGSGIIAITLALSFPQAKVYAVDLSPGALSVAKKNAERHGLIDRIAFHQGDLLSAIAPDVQFELVTANLPYVSIPEYGQVPLEVKSEPETALVAGPDGMDCIRQLVLQTPQWLVKGGAIVLEHGVSQKLAVQAELKDRFFNVETRQDIEKRPRVTYGYLS